MSRKDYIAMAKRLRDMKSKITANERTVFLGFVDHVSRFFAEENPKFNRSMFEGYINGTCGPSGGKIK